MVQIAETLLPAFDVPGWALRAIIILLAIGFLPALISSWGSRRPDTIHLASALAINADALIKHDRDVSNVR